MSKLVIKPTFAQDLNSYTSIVKMNLQTSRGDATTLFSCGILSTLLGEDGMCSLSKIRLYTALLTLFCTHFICLLISLEPSHLQRQFDSRGAITQLTFTLLFTLILSLSNMQTRN